MFPSYFCVLFGSLFLCWNVFCFFRACRFQVRWCNCLNFRSYKVLDAVACSLWMLDSSFLIVFLSNCDNLRLLTTGLLIFAEALACGGSQSPTESIWHQRMFERQCPACAVLVCWPFAILASVRLCLVCTAEALFFCPQICSYSDQYASVDFNSRIYFVVYYAPLIYLLLFQSFFFCFVALITMSVFCV